MSLDLFEVGRYAIKHSKEVGFTESAVSIRNSERTMVKFANNELTVVQSWSELYVELYLVKDGRIYLVGGPIKAIEDLKAMMSESYDKIRFLERSELYAPLPEPSGRPLSGLVDHVIKEDVSRVAGSVYSLIDACLKEGAERVAGVLDAGYVKYALFTSKGAELEEEKTYVTVYSRAFKGDNSGHWVWTSTRFDERKVSEVGSRAGFYASITKDVVSVDVGRYSAVLSPLIFSNLVNYVANASSALMSLLGLSMFVKYGPGSKVGSEELSVADDPLEVGLPGARGFDDEGISTFKKSIIEKGVFKGYLHNSKTAALMGASTTGNAGWLSPHPWNLIVEAGDMDEDEMVREVRRGFFVLNNWYTRYQNYVEGQFSTVTRDLLLYVENGEAKGSVKRLRVADTFPNVLSNIRGLSRSRYDIRWWEVPTPTRAPFVLVDNILFTRPEI